MIDFFQNNLQSFFIKIILGIIALVFIFFGVNTYNTNQVNVLVKINGHPVLLKDYQKAYRQAYQELQSYYQGSLDEEILSSLRKRTFNNIINQRLIIQKAQQSNLVVTDVELANWLYTNQYFQTDERFDRRKYNRYLKNNRLSRIEFEKDLRESLLSEKYLSLLQNALIPNQKQLEKSFILSKTHYSIQLLKFNKDLFVNQVKITDQDLKNYYDQHRIDFNQEKQFALKYFTLKLSDFIGRTTVRPKEIDLYYNQFLNEKFTQQEQFKIRQIFLKTLPNQSAKKLMEIRNKAQKIYTQLIKNPQQFTNYAKKYSDDSSSNKTGGNLGWVKKSDLPASLAEQIIKLKINTISEPIINENGYYIIYLKGHKPTTVITQKKARPIIVKAIQEQKALRKFKNHIKNLRKTLTTAKWQEISKKYSSIQKTKLFNRSLPLKQIPESNNLYNKLINQKQNDTGVYVFPEYQEAIVYSINQVVNAYIQPLQEVKTNVRILVTSEKQNEILKQKIQEYANTLKNLQAFKKLARKYHIKPKKIDFTYNDQYLPEIGYAADFIKKISLMKDKQLFLPILFQKNYYLVYKAKVLPGKINQKNQDKIKKFYFDSKQEQLQLLLNQFLSKYKLNQKIEYNHKLMNSLNI